MIAAATLLLAATAQTSSVTNLHGAGTTNPSMLFWNAMDIIMERARVPLHLTYRAVGSSTGQKEFVGVDAAVAAAQPLNHFGSGDIPMTQSRYDAVIAAGRQMYHVPFAMGGIGVFHSVPSSANGGADLHLTGCVLAKIFSRQITAWNHADILALNPNLNYDGGIKVVHRVHGSSSTAGFTEYLNTKCPASWVSGETGINMGTGSSISWPSDTAAAQGSGGMASYIASNEGAIGYIDAGHGHKNSLNEIALENKDGLYVTTTAADIAAAGTQALSASPSVLPADPSADFSAVNLYDLPGPNTWPITMISYFYVPKDLSSYDPMTAAILLYFLKFILSAEGQAMAEANMFVKLPSAVEAYNAATLATLATTLPTGAPTFETELSSTALPWTGAGDYMISGKRRSYAEVQRTNLEADVISLQTSSAASPSGVMTCPAGTIAVDTTLAAVDGCWRASYVAYAAVAGVVLGVFGVLLGLVGCILAACACSTTRTSKPRSREVTAAKARDLEVPSSSSSSSTTSGVEVTVTKA